MIYWLLVSWDVWNWFYTSCTSIQRRSTGTVVVLAQNVFRFLIGDTKNGDFLVVCFGRRKFMLEFEYYTLVDFGIVEISVWKFGSMIF